MRLVAPVVNHGSRPPFPPNGVTLLPPCRTPQGYIDLLRLMTVARIEGGRTQDQKPARYPPAGNRFRAHDFGVTVIPQELVADVGYRIGLPPNQYMVVAAEIGNQRCAETGFIS